MRRRVLLVLSLIPVLAGAGDFVTGRTEPYTTRKTGAACPYLLTAPEKCWTAGNANAVLSALDDLRGSVLTGKDTSVSSTGSTTARTLAARFADTVNVRDYGAKGDGTTDDTAALTAAIATGIPVFLPSGTYITSKQTITQDAVLLGAGRYASTIKLKSGTNDHVLYVSGDHKLTLRDLGIDGNYAGNPTMAPNYPCGVLVPVGSLDMRGCYVHGVRNHAIHTGNTDYDFNASLYAHDVFITDNVVDQSTGAESGTSTGANNLGDQIRIHRTQRAVVSGNIGKGGLSGIRTDYYCDHLNISGNVISSSYGDVGVTAALSTDVTISGNTLTGHGQHGIEVDGVWRGTVSNNTCTGNTKYGMLLGPFGPPTSAANYAGTMDGIAITYDAGHPGVNISNKDLTVSNNPISKNGWQGLGVISANGVLVSSNYVSDNNQGGTGGGNVAGVYIDGGGLNLDDVTLGANVFNNVGNQQQSAQQANVQYMTKALGNWHTPGTVHFTHPVRGKTNLSADPSLLNVNNLFVTPGALVADATSHTGYARQIADANAAGNVTLETRIPAPAFGSKLLLVRIRTPDTMTKVEIVANLYTGTTFKFTAYDVVKTGLTSAWTEYRIPLAGSLSSYAYDTIRVQLISDVTLTGNLNVDEVSIFTTTEQGS